MAEEIFKQYIFFELRHHVDEPQFDQFKGDENYIRYPNKISKIITRLLSGFLMRAHLCRTPNWSIVLLEFSNNDNACEKTRAITLPQSVPENHQTYVPCFRETSNDSWCDQAVYRRTHVETQLQSFFFKGINSMKIFIRL